MKHSHKERGIGKICKVCKEEIWQVSFGWGWACACPGTKDISEYNLTKANTGGTQ